MWCDALMTSNAQQRQAEGGNGGKSRCRCTALSRFFIFFD